MSWTIALWLVAWPVVAFVAISVIGVVVLACTSIWGLCLTYGFIAAQHAPLVPDEHDLGWALTTNMTTFLVHALGHRRHQLAL